MVGVAKMMMDESDFTSLRDALMPERETTQRLGAAYVALASRAEDERIDGLIRTLLQDRDVAFSAGLAALCWANKAPRRDYARELERAWITNRTGYRRTLLAASEASALKVLGERYARDADIELRCAYAEHLAGMEAEDALDGLLLLTHDDEASVVVAALGGLAGEPSRAFNAVLARLTNDPRKDVLLAAMPLALEHLELADVKDRLETLQSDEDLDLRLMAAEALARVRGRENLVQAEKLCLELIVAVDKRQHERARQLSEDIARLVPRHPEVEYQAARIAARDGDSRRALVTLHHLIGLQARWRTRAINEEDFVGLHGIAAWQEMIGAGSANE